MAHNNHIIDHSNKDVDQLLFNGVTNRDEAREYYLNLAGDWEDPNPPPVIELHEGVRVVRDDLLVGSKVRAGDLLISRIKENTLAYVQPRTGLAGVSILDVAKRHGKKVKLFMPSSKRISEHQACCIERGAEYEFHRIAAMPVLNGIAKKWADKHDDAYFIPLGLKHELVTAGFVKVASQIPEPEEVWTVISTGVLHRSLQIAWPNAKFHCVAVARNMKKGEIGHDRIISHPLPFTSHIKEDLTPFPSVNTYDAKAWKYIPKNTSKDILFWNVGTEPKLEDESIYDRIDSFRKWKKIQT
mgnify:FL=1|tara:strand:- start:637 stop:1533 length:897 start_codon:yes stop_codon:yes gene_type:complete